MKLTISSPDIQSGGSIPSQYSCIGENSSPPIEWDGVPDGAQSLALIVDDPDAPQAVDGPFAHWLVYNMPPVAGGVPPGFRPDLSDAIPGRNDFGTARYEGPCPPLGTAHTYYFRLYALDSRLDLPEGATRAQLLNAMQGHILEQAELQASFSREATAG